jgi:hypothetical protein
MENKDSADNKKLYVGTGGTLGIISLLGACGGACTAAAIPLGSLLGAIGLGGLAIYLPYLRWPLFFLALVLSFLVLKTVVKQGNTIKSAAVALALGGSLVFSAIQAFKPSPCQMRTTLKDMLRQLSPDTQKVIKEGIYALWPKLGRPPTVGELRAAVGFASDAQVMSSLDELRKNAPEVFVENTYDIKWLWPLSSVDLGITVLLSGEKPIHARCAIARSRISSQLGKSKKVPGSFSQKGT